MNLLLDPAHWTQEPDWAPPVADLDNPGLYDNGFNPECMLNMRYIGPGWVEGDSLKGEVQVGEDTAYLRFLEITAALDCIVHYGMEVENGDGFNWVLLDPADTYNPASSYYIGFVLSDANACFPDACGKGIDNHTQIDARECVSTAVDDEATVAFGFSGVAIVDVQVNDTECDDTEIDLVGALPPELEFITDPEDPNVGQVTVLPGTAPGIYTFDYRLGDRINSEEVAYNSPAATVTITVLEDDPEPPADACTDYPVCGCVASC